MNEHGETNSYGEKVTKKLRKKGDWIGDHRLVATVDWWIRGSMRPRKKIDKSKFLQGPKVRYHDLPGPSKLRNVTTSGTTKKIRKQANQKLSYRRVRPICTLRPRGASFKESSNKMCLY